MAIGPAKSESLPATDPKPLLGLAMNPPTLEMVAEATQGEAARLASEAQQAAAELIAASSGCWPTSEQAAKSTADQLAAAKAAADAAEAAARRGSGEESLCREARRRQSRCG